MAKPGGVGRILRRVVGKPVAGGHVPARLPFSVERYNVLFESLELPPLPAPILLVHTGGKPMAYRAGDGHRPGQSIPGFVTFLPPRVRSKATLRGVSEGTLIYFDQAGSLPSWLARSQYVSPASFTNEVITSVTRRLMHEVEADTSAASYLRVLGNALLAELQRELGRPGTHIGQAASRSELRIAHTAIAHMQAHLGEPLTVAALARACGVGPTSFSSSFREATGSTPHRYLRKLRVERACELLRTTALSVREVAEAVGFRGQAHFATVFLSERDLTPTAYRRASRRPRTDRSRPGN